MFRNHDFSDGGRAILIAAPTAEAVILADAKAALGISDSSQDAIITAAVASAADALDPAAGGWLGRALRPQTWELQLRSFSQHRGQFHFGPRHPPEAHRILLPFPPLISVTSVTYADVSGVDQVLALNTGYRILGKGQPYGKACLAPLYQASWPACRVDDASVRVRFICGYDEAANFMPKSLKAAIVLGARALMSVQARDMLLFEDRLEGVGSKRYQNNPAAAEIVTKAVSSLLVNLAIS